MFAEIFGLDGVIVIVVIALVLLFGGSKLPGLARSLGSAKGEFEKGMREGSPKDEKDQTDQKDEKDEPKGPPKAIESGNDSPSSQTRRDETTA
jgi:sec-independent protein translocase protein TatA